MSASRYQQWLLDKEAWEEARIYREMASRAETDWALLPYLIGFGATTAVCAAAAYGFSKYQHEYAASLALVATFISGSALTLVLFMFGMSGF